jgi:transcriptional antiterminator RfaH
MERWYTVHTKPHQERRVAAVLARHEIETFLPTWAHPNRSPAKPVAFFPRYFFMRVDYARVNPLIWRWTPGFLYIVSAGQSPIPVADEVIAMLAHRIGSLAEQGGEQRLRLPFSKGDLVRIKRGPFRDLLGIFDGPNDPEQRVRVLLKTMNRSMRVRISPDDLEKAEVQEQHKGDKPPRRTRGRGRLIRSRT